MTIKKGKIYLGIFDDYTMQRQLLHHLLEREKYEINYSAGALEQLREYFEHKQVDILLVHARSARPRALRILGNFMAQSEGNLKIIFYGCTGNVHPALPEAYKKYGDIIFYADDDVHSFYKNLEHVTGSFFPKEMQEVVRQKVLLPPEHPFYNVINNPVMVNILRLLSEGKNFREISNSLRLNEHTIRAYIKRMRLETDSINITQLVSSAKEFHLI